MIPSRSAVPFAAAFTIAGCVTEVELTRAPLTPLADAGAQDVVTSPWRVVASGVTDDLTAVHGVVANDVWMVGGNGRVLHWNGSALEVVPSRTTADLSAVRVMGPREVWVVGTQTTGEGVVLQWDGLDWRDLTPMTRMPTSMRGIWGAPDDVWVAGGDLTGFEPGIWHRTGVGWRPEMGPQPRPIAWQAVQGERNGDLWFVGDGPTVWNRGGGTWTEAPMPGGRPSAETLPTRGLCVQGGNVWYTTATATVRINGASVTPFPAVAAMRGLWCDPTGEVWAAGVAGRVGRFRAGGWSVEALTDVTLRAVWSAPDGTRWTVGDQGTVLRRVP